jgi:hypothetical protein
MTFLMLYTFIVYVVAIDDRRPTVVIMDDEG